MQSVEQSTKKAVVIYHDNCVDGFASAWAFHVLKEKDYQGGVEYIPCNYGERPEVPLGLDVYILDFSFPRDMLQILAFEGNHVLILDHHKTAKEALENWTDTPDNLEIVFDMSRSGAGITWDYFAVDARFLAGEPDTGIFDRPPLINYVEDRDLWKFDLDESKIVNSVIAITPKGFKEYSILSDKMRSASGMYRIKDAGTYLSLQHQQICEQIVLDARPCNILGNYDGLVCNCTPQFSSEVGNLLANKCGTFGATYHSDCTGDVKWSLRSNGDYDVSAIAKSFGGGGHRNAAGFKLSGGEGSGEQEVKLWNLPTI